MKKHCLKILPEYGVSVLKGDKTFELRRNDRNFQVGDLIVFSCPLDAAIDERLQKKNYLITYILKNVPEFGLDPGYCILALKEVEEK